MTKKTNQEASDLERLEAGELANQYLIYNRRSTDEPDSQKNSIKYQIQENRRFANKQALPIAATTIEGFCTAGVVSERHSGFKTDDLVSFSKEGLVQYRIERPKFARLVQLLSDGRVRGIICLCWDRISRNEGDNTIVRKLIEQGIDIQFAYATYEASSSGQLHMDIDGMFAIHYSRVISEKVSLTTKVSRQQGKCTYRAPLGYLNNGDMDWKPQDPERAPIIKELFERYAEGGWSLSDLARCANDQGMTTMPMRRRRTEMEILADDQPDIPKIGRQISENTVSRILRNPFYIGKVRGEHGDYVESTSHDALVSETTFNQVQAMLSKKTVSVQYSKKLDLPLRGLVRCAECRRVYTPYLKKGHVYYGARCAKGCGNSLRNCGMAQIIEAIKIELAKAAFTEQELYTIEACLDRDIPNLEAKRKRAAESHNRQTSRLHDDLNYLRENRLTLLKTGAYTPEALVAEEQKLLSDIGKLEASHMTTGEEIRQKWQEVASVSELLKTLVLRFEIADTRQKDQIARLVCSELFLSQDTLEFKPQSEFAMFFGRKFPIGDPIAWISELGTEVGEFGN